MPWTGPYVFTRDNGQFTGTLVWTDDLNASVKITAAHHDNHDQDIADGFALCLRNDGGNSPTANISWGSHKITALGYGSASTDAAAYGQTTTAATLNPSTNVLTFTRPDGTTYTVDLSALAVGGSTTDFARYSNALNPFQHGATFAGTLGCFYSVQMADAVTGTLPYTWNLNALTSTNFQITNTAGASLLFTGNSGAATLSVNGSAVWTAATLPASTFAGVLTADGSYTITGPWTFTNTGTKFVPFLWTSALGGGDWTVGPDTSTQISFTDPIGLSPMTYVIDSAPKAGAYLQIGPNAKRCWDQGSLQSGLTSLPTGGEDGNLAVVQSGADRGLYTRIAGSWVLLIAFP